MHYSSRQILRTMQIHVAWGIYWEREEQAELLFGPATGENEREVLEDPFKCMGGRFWRHEKGKRFSAILLLTVCSTVLETRHGEFH